MIKSLNAYVNSFSFLSASLAMLFSWLFFALYWLASVKIELLDISTICVSNDSSNNVWHAPESIFSHFLHQSLNLMMLLTDLTLKSPFYKVK